MLYGKALPLCSTRIRKANRRDICPGRKWKFCPRFRHYHRDIPHYPTRLPRASLSRTREVGSARRFQICVVGQR